MIGELATYTTFLVRVGVHAQIARLQSEFEGHFERGLKVVCRTSRGIELGEVLALSPLSVDADAEVQFDGTILRQAAPEELYLQTELKKLADQYLPEASAAIQEIEPQALLLEVEPMLDCQTVYFHFLGVTPESLHGMMDELALRFQQLVQKSRLAELLDKGCGPGCGTKESGCSSSGCKGCAVAQACGSKKRS